jgi:hypothetical protein
VNLAANERIVFEERIGHGLPASESKVRELQPKSRQQQDSKGRQNRLAAIRF